MQLEFQTYVATKTGLVDKCLGTMQHVFCLCVCVNGEISKVSYEWTVILCHIQTVAGSDCLRGNKKIRVNMSLQRVEVYVDIVAKPCWDKNNHSLLFDSDTKHKYIISAA